MNEIISFLTSNTLNSSYFSYFLISIITLFFYLLYFFLCYSFYFKEQKKLAWFITILNSFLTTIISLIYIIIKIQTNQSILSLNYIKEDYIHSNDNLSIIISISFGWVNILDLLLGLLFYKKQLGLLTTYIHHTLYTWLMFFLITGNGIIIQTPTPFSKAFIWCLIEEFPTFILAVGSIFPSLRSDLLFGVTFFFLRIVYHTYLFYIMWNFGAYTPMLVLYLITLLMHLVWFQTWFVKYGIYYIIPSKKKVQKTN